MPFKEDKTLCGGIKIGVNRRFHIIRLHLNYGQKLEDQPERRSERLLRRTNYPGSSSMIRSIESCRRLLIH